MMMTDDDDPETIQLLFEQDVIGKFHEIGTAKAAGIIVMSFWICSDSVDGRVQFAPEPSPRSGETPAYLAAISRASRAASG